jgi:phospholipid transport system substrate-binding protein
MTRSNLAKGPSLFLTGLAFCAGLALPTQRAAAVPGSNTDTVRGLYTTLLNTMRDGQTLGAAGRYARLAPVIHQSFDIPFMTRLAVGPDWNTLNPTQQAQVTEAFERYIAAVYAERFHNYAGEQLTVTGEQTSPAGTVITSQIVASDGQPTHINYLMRNDKIADVYLEGTISELATRRSEFSGILKAQGVNGLIAALNSKATSLGARSL